MVITEEAVHQSARFWADLHANPKWHAFSEALALRGPRYARLAQLLHDQEYLHTLDMAPSQLKNYHANDTKLSIFHAQHRAYIAEVCPFVGLYEPHLKQNDFQAMLNTIRLQTKDRPRYQRHYAYPNSTTDAVETVTVDATDHLVSIKLPQALPDLDVTLHLHRLNGDELHDVTWEYHHTLEGVSFESPYPLFREVEYRFIEPFNVIRVREIEMTIG